MSLSVVLKGDGASLRVFISFFGGEVVLVMHLVEFVCALVLGYDSESLLVVMHLVDGVCKASDVILCQSVEVDSVCLPVGVFD